MMIPLGAHQEGILPSKQGGPDASRDLPLLLSLIDQREDEQQEQAERMHQCEAGSWMTVALSPLKFAT